MCDFLIVQRTSDRSQAVTVNAPKGVLPSGGVTRGCERWLHIATQRDGAGALRWCVLWEAEADLIDGLKKRRKV
ncbi:hypothetical protein E2C01_031634 [Portunus trituberculatus]|uniref:Uncharacterized protein n=1 Tax=Portunus trituberculatus TaxID=210409 RepID=A0A5B7ET98_PORTR|nr:hypothetical protein [Portunus trituberculatus]